MKLALVGLGAMLGLGAEASPKNGSTSLRVLLDEQPAVLLTSPSGELYVRPASLRKWYRTRKPLSVRCTKGGKIQIGNKLFRPPLQVRGGPLVSDPITLSHRLPGQSYAGALLVHPGEKGCLVVNHLPLNLYLEGTLAAEVVPSWPIDALKAQAVASRTYALKKAQKPKHPHYELVSTVMDQVYKGLAKHATIQKAVEETKGQVLTHNGRIAQIFFHSRCGGQTTSEKIVWNSHKENHTTVECAYCQENPTKWTASVPLVQLASLFSFSSPPSKIKRSPSPGKRWHRLELTSGKQVRKLSGDQLRQKVGYGKLKSTLIDGWKVKDKALVVQGRGSGHGVGMCQWGAQHLASAGKNYRAILKHYYPKLRLRRFSKKALDFSKSQG